MLEQSAAFSEIGAGIQISPNASRVLIGLGIGEAIAEHGFAPETLDIRNWRSGGIVFSRRLGTEARQRFGAPYLNIHRADLHRVLLEAAEATPSIELRLDARIVGVEQGNQSGHVLCANSQQHEADIIVGADGIKSVVRASLFGSESPRFTGCVAWRGLVPAELLSPLARKPAASLWMGPRAHFVHYLVRGGNLVNFVGVVEQRGWEVESWTERGSKAELIAAFGSWHEPVHEIVQAADPAGCYRWALFDRKPMHRWGRGNMTLLGDACHPTLPFLAQGGCMAIEDAAVLGECLAGEMSVGVALQRYESLRRGRTARIQQISRVNKSLYHLPDPAAWVRDLGAPMVVGHFSRRLDGLFAYDANNPAI